MADAAVNRKIRVFHLLDVYGHESDRDQPIKLPKPCQSLGRCALAVECHR